MKLVTTPKLPPPPRSPQNRSGFSLSAGRHDEVPSAVTTSHERSASIASPDLRIRWPMPPPSVSPAMPVWLTIAAGRGQPEGLGLAVDVRVEGAALRRDRARDRVDAGAASSRTGR